MYTAQRSAPCFVHASTMRLTIACFYSSSKQILHGTVATSRISADLDPARHAATEILDNVGQVANGVAVRDQVPTASAVAVVVEP